MALILKVASPKMGEIFSKVVHFPRRYVRFWKQKSYPQQVSVVFFLATYVNHLIYLIQMQKKKKEFCYSENGSFPIIAMFLLPLVPLDLILLSPAAGFFCFHLQKKKLYLDINKQKKTHKTRDFHSNQLFWWNGELLNFIIKKHFAQCTPDLFNYDGKKKKKTHEEIF